MNVIFISIAYPKTATESNLYTDLMDEFVEHGHKVYVVCSNEKRFGKGTYLSESNGITVLRVKTGNITSNDNYVVKGLAIIQLQTLFIHAINEYFQEILFDLIIYSTPPIYYNKIIEYFKKESNAMSYLLLKDIHPQDAVDLGLLSKWNPIYWYIRKHEKVTYNLSDQIGCMSPGNVKYLLQHNTFLSPNKVQVCANSLKDRGRLKEHERNTIRNKIRNNYLIGDNDLLLIYGGNLGISQGLNFLLEIFKVYTNIQRIKFLIVGEGSWFSHLEKHINESDYKNVTILKRLPPQEFREMLIASDLGLIFLNPKHTIPNFPSRLTSYLEVGLPVISCTDTATDIGNIIEASKCGYKVISGDLESFQEIVHTIMNDFTILNEFSINARKLFEQKYTTKTSYDEIMKSLHQ